VKCIYVELPENKLQFIVYLNQCTLSSYVPTAYTWHAMFESAFNVHLPSVVGSHGWLFPWQGLKVTAINWRGTWHRLLSVSVKSSIRVTAVLYILRLGAFHYISFPWLWMSTVPAGGPCSVVAL